MARRYLHKSGSKFLWNGNSQIRVNFLGHIKHKSYPQHVVKVFEVAQVIRLNDKNPVSPGQVIGVAFPMEKAQAKEYEWGPNEPFQVPIKIKDEPLKVKHGSL